MTEARMLFKRLDRESWKQSNHNPVGLLRKLPGELLAAVAKDPDYLRHYDAVLARFRRYLASRGEWFMENVKPNLRGRAIICRYADDWVCAFQYRDDAERF